LLPVKVSSKEFPIEIIENLFCFFIGPDAAPVVFYAIVMPGIKKLILQREE
jgi:hypothetical protein